MTDRDKKLSRNRTAGFLIFTGQAGKQMEWHTAMAVSKVISNRSFDHPDS